MKEDNLLIAEIMIKLSAIERLLAKNNIIKSEELTEEMKTISKEVVEYMTVNINLFKNQSGN